MPEAHGSPEGPPSARLPQPAGRAWRAPDLRTAALYGGGAAVGGALLWVVAAGPLAITAGLVALAAFVGWLIGAAVSNGGWRGTAHAPYRPTAAVGAVAAAGSWVLAEVGVYVYSLATLPAYNPEGSSQLATSLGERIAATPIVDFYARQFGPLDALALLLLLGLAAWTAR